MNFSCENYEIVTSTDNSFLLCDTWTLDMSIFFITFGILFFLMVLIAFIRKI